MGAYCGGEEAHNKSEEVYCSEGSPKEAAGEAVETRKPGCPNHTGKVKKDGPLSGSCDSDIASQISRGKQSNSYRFSPIFEIKTKFSTSIA